MRTHPEPIRNRLKLFFFLVNAMPAPPVPRLVHKRPMRRIHQPNNPLVHMRRQIAIQMRYPIFFAERRQFWRRRRPQPDRSRGGACPSLFSSVFTPRSRNPRPRIHKNPKISIPLLAGIMPRKNPLHFQFVLASKRRDLDALPAASLEFPPVITALQILSVKPPIRERNPSMRTRIPHRKRFPLSRASQNQRHFQKHRRLQMVAGNFAAPQSRIPEVPKESCVAFGNIIPRCRRASLHQRLHWFAHHHGIVVHRVAPEQPARAAAVQQQRHGEQCLSCIEATGNGIQLRVSDFGVILSEEQINVRRFLLADPASLAFVASPFFLLLLTIHHSPLTTHYSLLFRGLLWP